MKKLLIILSLLCSISLLLAFAACGERKSPEEENDDSPPSSEEPVRYSEGLGFYLNPDGESYYVYRGNCTDTDIVIPGTYEGKPVTAIGDRSFSYEFDITSVVIPEGVTYIGEDAFHNSLKLEVVVLPNSLTYIGAAAFGNCPALKSIDIPEGVTAIENLTFTDCRSMTSVTIPSSVTYIGNAAFSGCTSLTSVEIPDGVEVIARAVFYDCTNLANITLPDSVTLIGEMLLEGTAYYNQSANWTNGILYVGNHLVAAKDTVSGTITVRAGTRTIADSAFKYRDRLTGIVLPAGLVTIGVSAFFDCALTSITIPSSVTTIGLQAFFFISELKSAIFENPNGWLVTDESIEPKTSEITGLDDPATAATYLTNTYENYTWTRR